MAGKSDFLEALYLNLIFKGTTNAAWAATAGTATLLYFSLHTADPTDAGTQTSNEVAYTSYARVGVTRGAGFTVSGTSPTSVSPAAAVNFPAATGGTATATFFGIGDSASGAGNLLYAGAISPSISISTGVTPQLTVATAVTED
jgi:hypothetical protein